MATIFTTAQSTMPPAAASCWRWRASTARSAPEAATSTPVRVLDRGGERPARSGILLASSAVSRRKDCHQHQLRRAVSSARTQDIVVTRRADRPQFLADGSGSGAALRTRDHVRSAAGAGQLLPIRSFHAGPGRIPAFQSWPGNPRVYGKPDNFAAAEFTSTTRSSITSRADEFREDWDFTSLEHAARFGFTIGLNVANQE